MMVQCPLGCPHLHESFMFFGREFIVCAKMSNVTTAEWLMIDLSSFTQPAVTEEENERELQRLARETTCSHARTVRAVFKGKDRVQCAYCSCVLATEP